MALFGLCATHCRSRPPRAGLNFIEIDWHCEHSHSLERLTSFRELNRLQHAREMIDGFVTRAQQLTFHVPSAYTQSSQGIAHSYTTTHF